MNVFSLNSLNVVPINISLSIKINQLYTKYLILKTVKLNNIILGCQTFGSSLNPNECDKVVNLCIKME